MSGHGLLWGALRIVEGARMLWRQPSLWPICVLPVILTALFFAAALWAFFGLAFEPLDEGLRSFLRAGDVEAWYQWLWIGPLRVLGTVLRWVIVALVLFLVYFLFSVVGMVLASPFLDRLSFRVEQLHGDGLVLEDGRGLRSAVRVVCEDLKRTGFFLCGQALLLALGLLPGLQVPVVAVTVLFSAFFLCLDYTAYLLDRRVVRFRTRCVWLWQHRGASVGFGLAALVTFLVPGLNFLALPVLVTSGTLLALELEAPQSSEV